MQPRGAAVVDSEITRREVVSRVASGEYNNVSLIHEIVDRAVDDVTQEILADAALSDISANHAELQANSLDHAHDLTQA
jgi:hypothetical protein